MDVVYYVSGVLMVVVLVVLIAATIFFLAKPHHLQKSKRINKPVSRVVILLTAITMMFTTTMSFGVVLAMTEPAGIKAARTAREAADEKTKREAAEARQHALDEQNKREVEAKKPVVKTETTTEIIPFEATQEDDNTLTKGETRVKTEGVNGERTISFEVTYVEGKETARKQVLSEVTKAPVTKVTQVGTYVAPVVSTPAPTPTYSAPEPTVQSNVRIGAICEDGWQSSATGRGACSHHGGVLRWLYG